MKANKFEFKKYKFTGHGKPAADTTDLKDLLLHDKKRILSLAVSATKTAYRYHEDDFNHVISFLNDFDSLYRKFTENLRDQNLDFLPKGNIFMVLSANEPLVLTFIPVIHALSLGNNVYLKPSSQNGMLVEFLSGLIKKSGIGKERLDVLSVSKDEIENVAQADINMVYWFGSRNVVSKVMPVFSEQGKEFVYESEGNDLIYIGSSADLVRSSGIVAESLFRHNGQCCNAVKGVLCHSTVYEKFKSLLSERLKSVVAGNPGNGSTEISDECVASNSAAERFSEEVIESDKSPVTLITDKKKIARVMFGVSKDNKSLSHSTFGPAVWVSEVETPDEAIEFANRSQFGIGFTAITTDRTEIEKVRNFSWFPRININRNPLEVSYREPWGGIRASGAGGVKPWFYKFADLRFISGE